MNKEKPMKGGYNRKKNHLANHFTKQWLTKGEINRVKRYIRKLEKCK